ncbi:MAG: cysteine synthase family protein [Candidatus Bathyarchaeota archaeon]|nr:MAG: cysteine synthase family protein [Candidatus Bathyarchaeota archaeon]
MAKAFILLEVGNTPLLEVDGVYAKLECANPLGSIKDRMAKYIIEQSEKMGLLHHGMTIVEASSGNTGIALSYFARQKGYPVVIVMPRNMTEERKKILRHLRAKLVLCSEGDFKEAASIRDRISQKPQYFNPDQFSNPLNAECHYHTTAQEILDQIPQCISRIDAFVSGVGTGGTLIGCGRRLRKAFPDIRIIAVEPSESPVMSGGTPGLHKIQGIGDGFVPELVSNGVGGLSELIDEVICVSSNRAIDAAKYLAKKKGVCVGVSSGANYLVAKKAAAQYGVTVTVFPDGFLKYGSYGLTRDGSEPCQYKRKCNPSCLREIEVCQCCCARVKPRSRDLDRNSSHLQRSH